MDLPSPTDDAATTMISTAPTDTSGPTSTSRAARLVEWFRRSLMVVTIAAFLYVAYGYCQLFREWRQGSQPTETPSTPAFEMMPLAGALPLDGPWTFADLDWNLRSSVVTSEQLSVRLKALAEPPQQDATTFPNVSDDLLHLIDALQLKPAEHDGCELYRIDRANLKAQLLVRKVDGHPRAISFVGAYPQDGKRWQVFELTPRAAAATSADTETHMLPMPTGARRQGGRFADDGRLLLELVSLDSNSDALQAAWKTDGWEVRPSGFGNGNGFSYLCRKGDEVVYAWSSNPIDKLQTIMLVHSPTTAELEAQKLIPND